MATNPSPLQDAEAPPSADNFQLKRRQPPVAASVAAAAVWMRMPRAQRCPSQLRHARRCDLPLSNQCLYNKQQITSAVRIYADELYIRRRVRRGTVIVSERTGGVPGPRRRSPGQRAIIDLTTKTRQQRAPHKDVELNRRWREGCPARSILGFIFHCSFITACD